MEKRDWYSIEEHRGEKLLHYHGFTDSYWKDDLWSFVDLTWCLIPLTDVLAEANEKRYDLLAEHAEVVHQYQGEYTKDKAKKLLENYYGTVVFGLGDRECSPGSNLPLEDLTTDTPCGEYWF